MHEMIYNSARNPSAVDKLYCRHYTSHLTCVQWEEHGNIETKIRDDHAKNQTLFHPLAVYSNYILPPYSMTSSTLNSFENSWSVLIFLHLRCMTVYYWIKQVTHRSLYHRLDSTNHSGVSLQLHRLAGQLSLLCCELAEPTLSMATPGGAQRALCPPISSRSESLRLATCLPV